MYHIGTNKVFIALSLTKRPMKPRKFNESLTFRLSQSQRIAVQHVADEEKLSLGEAARDLLSEGLRSRGIEVL